MTLWAGLSHFTEESVKKANRTHVKGRPQHDMCGEKEVQVVA